MADTETSRIARSQDPLVLFGGGLVAALAASPRGEAIVCESARVAASWALPLTFVNVGAGADERDGLTKLVATRAPGAAIEFASGRRVDAALCAVAKERGSGLIALGALEHEAGLAWYRGSVARRVARAAPCSVLLLSRPRLQPAAFAHPQVDVRGYDRARPLLALALALARRERAQDLHVVVEYEAAGLHLGSSTEEADGEDGLRQALQHEEELALAQFVGGFDAAGVAVKRWCVAGRRGFAAVEHARANGRDLLLWRAPNKRLGLIDKLFPHDVEAALRDLACPLLLYRPPRGAARTRGMTKAGG